jgi:signal transduction histidine kinase
MHGQLPAEQDQGQQAEQDMQQFRRLGIGWRQVDDRQRERQEQRREQQLDRGQRSQRLQVARTKSDFMATMSHELRTPLNAIMGYTDLLHMHVGGALTDAQEQHVARIRASADHLLTVIEEILTFSRAEAGKEIVHFERFDAVTLVRECGSMVEATARARGLTFTISAPDAPMPMTSDPVKLRQVLLNLLGNAVKFTDTGGVTLSVSATPDGRVLFTVEDSGCGIGPEHIERIFEAFWQVQGGATRRNGGTGLGLTVSRQLVELLGGELRVTSRMGEGSRFEVRLPG